jgi:hypothetical protein
MESRTRRSPNAYPLSNANLCPSVHVPGACRCQGPPRAQRGYCKGYCGGYCVVGKPRSMVLALGSGQREVTTLGRV